MPLNHLSTPFEILITYACILCCFEQPKSVGRDERRRTASSGKQNYDVLIKKKIERFFINRSDPNADYNLCFLYRGDIFPVLPSLTLFMAHFVWKLQADSDKNKE